MRALETLPSYEQHPCRGFGLRSVAINGLQCAEGDEQISLRAYFALECFQNQFCKASV